MKENIATTKEYYDKRFGKLSQKLNEEETIRWKAIELVLHKNISDRNLKIADFGCGRGWLSNKLSAFGEVSGFDVSEQAVLNAKVSYPSIFFTCLDASEKIPDAYVEKFDLVISSEVIEHIEDQSSYVENIKFLLKPGGSFLITTPNGKWFDPFYMAGREAWKQPIENWLSPDSLTLLFENSGMTVHSRTTFNSEWIFSFQPEISPKFLSYALTRKILKGFFLYSSALRVLNKTGYGINSLVYGTKKNA